MKFAPVSREQLFATFREAFADYAVDMSRTTERAWSARCIKNNVDFDLSPGVFDGERMVAFTLIAVDVREGRLCAFDAATGVVPDWRGRGLAGRMLEHVLPELRRRGAKQFLLEVLHGNDSAIAAYRKVGFEITRTLACFGVNFHHVTHRPDNEDSSITVSPVDRATIASFAREVDWTPSWENAFASIERMPGELVAYGAHDGNDCVGIIVYTPVLGLILSLVVRRTHRRRGIGARLVRHLARHPPGAPGARLLNVDRADCGMLEFLDHVGFRHLIDQYEMTRPI
jgi:ribosomal protein S18 acetylase RimI-like enzyme